MRTETLDRINDLLQKSTNVALKIIYDDKLIDTNIKKKKFTKDTCKKTDFSFDKKYL